jgi:hypothetical protein
MEGEMRTIMFAIILILSSAPLNAQMMDGALYDVDALRKEQNRQRQEMEKQRRQQQQEIDAIRGERERRQRNGE